MFNFTTPKFEMPTATHYVEGCRHVTATMLNSIPNDTAKDAVKKMTDSMFSSMELVADQIDRNMGTFNSMFGLKDVNKYA
jgi:hypothetical protein